MPIENKIKEFGAYPVSIVLLGIIAIIITSEQGFGDIILKILILLAAFIVLTFFNTQYFRWFKRR